MKIGNVILDELEEKIYLQPDQAEIILLETIMSNDAVLASQAKIKLMQVYGIGRCKIAMTSIDIPEFPNYDKLRSFVAEEIQDENDMQALLEALYYDFKYILFDDLTIRGLEEALLAVVCDESDYLYPYEMEGREQSKKILFWLYLKGQFDYYDWNPIEIPSLQDNKKAAQLLRYSFLMNGDFNEEFYDMKYEGELDTFLEEAYAVCPENDDLVRTWVDRCAVNGEIDKIVEIVNYANQETTEHIALDLLHEWDYFFDYEGQEIDSQKIERLLISFSEKGVHKELLLSLYQFGSAKLYTITGEYEVLQPLLKDAEKAKKFAEDNCIDMLDEVIKIKT